MLREYYRIKSVRCNLYRSDVIYENIRTRKGIFTYDAYNRSVVIKYFKISLTQWWETIIMIILVEFEFNLKTYITKYLSKHYKMYMCSENLYTIKNKY